MKNLQESEKIIKTPDTNINLPSKNTLKLDNLEIVKGFNRLFSKFNYIFNFGKLYILTGSNGIGKTTLLRCICGFIRPESGSLLWNNITINNNAAVTLRH